MNASTLVTRAEAAGAKFTLKLDSSVRVERCPAEMLADLKAHRSEVAEAIKARQVSRPATAPVIRPRPVAEGSPLTPLELARQITEHFIASPSRRAAIWAAAGNDAKNWRFLGISDNQKILADNVISAVEQECGLVVCFVAAAEAEKFTGWFTVDKNVLR